MISKKIVHIATDEKFINAAVWQFEKLEVESIFYIIVDDIDKKLKHVKLKKNIFLIANNIKELEAFGRSLDKASLICSHGLSYFSSIVINNLIKENKVLWFLYGKELYNNPYLYDKRSIVGRETFDKFLSKSLINSIKTKFNDFFRNLFYLMRKGTLSPYKEITNAMRRSDYCGVLYEEEYKIVKRRLRTNIKFLKFSYYPIEKMLGDTDTFISGNNILLGNSATYTNNHLEAITLLKKIELEGRYIIMPLSYGNSKYKEKVILESKGVFGSYFSPIVSFMPLLEYNAYIQSCGIVIMNHYRQQAVGNVLTMLWMGAKVYLDKRNSLFTYLRRIGVYVYELEEDLNENNKDVFNSLTKEQQKHNRECLRKEITKKELLKVLNSQINSIICP